MARRKKSSPAEDFLELVAMLPWWAGVVLALIFYVLFHRWAQPVPWSDVNKVIETKRFLLIHATSDGPFFVPRHAVSSSDAERLREFLAREFQSRPGKLKMLPAG